MKAADLQVTRFRGLNNVDDPVSLGLSWLTQADNINITSADKIARRDGYDLEITAAVSRAVGIPVVASGGAGGPEHLADAITLGGADAALAAGIFHFGQCTIREVKELFVSRGITVRPPPT